jgi:hypothetical protein
MEYVLTKKVKENAMNNSVNTYLRFCENGMKYFAKSSFSCLL